MAKVPFNQDIDEELKTKFDELVTKRGYTKYRAVEASIRAFLVMPGDAQAQLMSNDCDSYEVIVNALLSAEIQKHLAEVGPTATRFLALLKQAKERDARKK